MNNFEMSDLIFKSVIVSMASPKKLG